MYAASNEKSQSESILKGAGKVSGMFHKIVFIEV